MCRTPEYATELTLQPLRRYPQLLDAVVVFSDILIIPPAMGLVVTMEAGAGPVLPEPLNTPADLARLNLGPIDAQSAFSFLYEAIRQTRVRAAQEVGKAVPVIGFCGGPWTLMGYMVEGGGSKDGYLKAKKWLMNHPVESRQLLAALSRAIADCLVCQWEAGASILQVFESSSGELSPHRFREFLLPYLVQIERSVRARVPSPAEGGPLLIVFPRNAHAALEWLAAESEYDVIGVDWATDPRQAVEAVTRGARRNPRREGRVPALQGNLDPHELFCESPAELRRGVKAMLEGFGGHPLIGNLGHGMMPAHTPEALREFFQSVHDYSSAAYAKQ
jgi:uroporphyrinogen decarboxylase